MKSSYYVLFIFIVFSCPLKAQWISLEGSMGPGTIKNLLEQENFSGEYIYGQTEGSDTTYIKTQYSGKSRNQTVISEAFSLNMFMKINVPLRPRLTLHTGIGLGSVSFRYREASGIIELNSIRDTLYNPNSTIPVINTSTNTGTGPAPVSTEDGVVCDSVYVGLSLWNNTGEKFTRNSLSNLVLPLEVSYNIIPNNLSLRASVNFYFSTSNRQSYSKKYLSLDYFQSTENFMVCEEGQFSVANNDTALFTSMSIGTFARIEAQTSEKMKAFVSISTTFNSITNPEIKSHDSNYDIALTYRPIFINLGLSLDLFFSKRAEQKRTNYLIKTSENGI